MINLYSNDATSYGNVMTTNAQNFLDMQDSKVIAGLENIVLHRISTSNCIFFFKFADVNVVSSLSIHVSSSAYFIKSIGN